MPLPVRHLAGFLVGCLTLLAGALPAQAQTDPAARVGRISLLEGPTLFRTDREDSGSAASLNWPITSGAILDTERGSRAEVWIGSTAYRLGSESRVEFATVDDRNVVVLQAAGSLAIAIRDRDQADDVEVRTPNGRIQFGSPGRYRIDVGAGRTNVAATTGSAYVQGGSRNLTVEAGRTASIDSSGDVALYGQSLHDGFDDWVAERDAASRPRVAQRYVSPAMTGYQDLDAYGDWTSQPEYGSVWYPRAMPIGWAPYRQGRWAWIAPWGWTWVDAAPWGFAPFHYGRWVEVRGRWGWVPGAYVARPVYAPALVGWIGNPGWSVSLSIGSGPAVGWFPLAPREVYVPVYRSSPTYIRQVNVTHVTNVTVIDRAVSGHGPGHFAHRDSPRAVTVVPANSLREGTPIRASSWSGRDRRELREAPVSARAPSASWLAPTAVASRPGSQEGRDRDAPRGAFRADPLPRGGGDRPPAGVQTELRRDGQGDLRRAPEQRPLPPGIDRLPAQPRNDESRASPREMNPLRSDDARATPPAAINAPAERPRQEFRQEDRRPRGSDERPESANRQPSLPAIQAPPPERSRFERRSTDFERPTPAASPAERRFEQSPPPLGEPRHRLEMATPSEPVRQQQPQVIPAQPRESSMERATPMERRIERPNPAFGEGQRQREIAPPPQVQHSPQPQPAPMRQPEPAMERRMERAAPMREPPQMERRGPAEPHRPEGRRERNDQGQGSRMQ